MNEEATRISQETHEAIGEASVRRLVVEAVQR